LLEDSQRVFGNLLLQKIVGHNILDKLANVFISTTEIFIKLIGDHLPKLFSLLDGLRLFNGRVELATLFGILGLDLRMLTVVHLDF
jgi:hypothetical protein